MEGIPWKWQHVGTCWPGTCPSTYKALPICSKTSVIHQSKMCKALPTNRNRSVSNKNPRLKRKTTNSPKWHWMSSTPHFPITSWVPTTVLKKVKFNFAPSFPTVEAALTAGLESHTLCIFRYCYQLPYSHASIHHWYCKLDYCPYHHPY